MVTQITVANFSNNGRELPVCPSYVYTESFLQKMRTRMKYGSAAMPTRDYLTFCSSP
jgi:hypothetical protein